MNVIVPRNTTIPTKMVGRVTTVDDNQTAASFLVYEGERPVAKENNFLGVFVLSDIPPAPKGVPKFDVWFDINADGILTASAEDIDTGNKNQITITNQSRLSKEEVDRLLEEAEKYRADDKQYLKKVRAKNDLENYANSMWETIRDYAKKIRNDDKKSMENAIQKTIQWLDWNFQLSDASKFEEKMKELQAFCEPIIAEASKPEDNTVNSHTQKHFGGWNGIARFLKFLNFGKDESA